MRESLAPVAPTASVALFLGSLPVRRLVSLAAVVALAGCSLAPTYQRPELPVPAALPQAGAASQASGESGASAADVSAAAAFDCAIRSLPAATLTRGLSLLESIIEANRTRVKPLGAKVAVAACLPPAAPPILNGRGAAKSWILTSTS